MIYKITIKKSAAKSLKSLPKKIIQPITKSILGLAENPRPPGCKKLKGLNSELWRIRNGDYRIIYSIEDKIHVIDIHEIGHRKAIYV